MDANEKIEMNENHQKKLADMWTEMEEKLKQLHLKRSEVPTEAEKELEGAVRGKEVKGSNRRSLKMMKPEKVKSGKRCEKEKSRKYNLGKPDQK